MGTGWFFRKLCDFILVGHSGIMRKTYLFLLLMIIILPAVGLARYVRGEEGVNFAELCTTMYALCQLRGLRHESLIGVR